MAEIGEVSMDRTIKTELINIDLLKQNQNY